MQNIKKYIIKYKPWLSFNRKLRKTIDKKELV